LFKFGKIKTVKAIYKKIIMENDLITLKTDCKLTNVPSSIEPAKLQRIFVKRNTTFVDTAQRPASQLPLSRGGTKHD